MSGVANANERPQWLSAGYGVQNPLLRNLASRARLTEADALRIDSGLGDIRKKPAGSEVAGDETQIRAALMSGWVAELILLPDGRRQIVALLLPGELIELAQAARLGVTLMALTPVRHRDATDLGRSILRMDAQAGGLPLAWRGLREAAEQRLVRQVVRLGRLPAYERVVDLLLDLHDRQRRAGLADARIMPFPLTQEAMADHLGLSVVHVNRTLQQLRRDRLIDYRNGRLSFSDPARIAALLP